MTRFDRIERVMPALLDDLAVGPPTDYLDEVLGVTAATSQRPAWTFLQRWLPMSDLTYRATFGSSIRLQLLLVVAFLILCMLGVATVIGGMAPDDERLNLFEPGRSGLVAFETSGDIRGGDPATGLVNQLVAGPAVDRLPAWSLDGRQLAFIRLVDVGLGALYVIDTQGAAPVLVRPDAFPLVTGLAWSPDGRSILVSWMRGTRPVVSLVDVRTGTTTDLRYEQSVTAASFRPPDGREIMFVGGEPGSSGGQGIFAYDRATGTIRTIVEQVPGAIVQGEPTWSPDGSRLAYAISVRRETSRAFTVSAEGGEPRPVNAPGDTASESGPAWAHDGTHVALIRWYENGAVVAVVDPSEGGEGVETPIPEMGSAGSRRPPRNLVASLLWAPDDSRLLVRPLLASGVPARQVLIDPWAGSAVPLSWVSTSDPAWQRLEP